MEGLIFRFQKVIEEVAAGNRSLFSRETGKVPSFATDVCKGRILPTIPYLIQLAAKYSISLDWLLLGKGKMYLDSTNKDFEACLLYTSPSPRDATLSRMPSSA